MLIELQESDWMEAFGEAGSNNPLESVDVIPPGSSIPSTKFTREDVKTIIDFSAGQNDEENWIGVFLPHDGRYALIRSGCDYTGWD